MRKQQRRCDFLILTHDSKIYQTSSQQSPQVKFTLSVSAKINGRICALQIHNEGNNFRSQEAVDLVQCELPSIVKDLVDTYGCVGGGGQEMLDWRNVDNS